MKDHDMILLEAPVYTLEAALGAERFGVDRLELCADFGEGGTTPSAGMLAIVKRKVSIPVFVMIRPRGGDFLYAEEEIAVMKEDMRILHDCGADGFVFGVLDEDNKVDEASCRMLVENAYGKPCTFHRAFDLIPDKEEALEKIIGCGFQRILTSGGENTVEEGLETILRLMERAGERIIVMPGGGSRPTHLPRLYQQGNLKEIHASCKLLRNSSSRITRSNLKLSLIPETEGNILTIDPGLVRQFRDAIAALGPD